MSERCALSRRELREDGRRGVVGRERGERERRRWEREDGGSWTGVVDAIVVFCCVYGNVQASCGQQQQFPALSFVSLFRYARAVAADSNTER